MLEVFKATLPFLMHGLWITFQISVVTIISGSLLGFVVGLVPVSYTHLTLPTKGLA